MQPLNGHNVLLGISGGIAAYKSAILARRLIDAGAEVRVVMTAGAQAFITPLTLQALTGNPVHTDLLDPAAEAAMGHIELARWADSVLIAPATASTLARLAHGFADDLLSTLVLATDARVIVAPAMNRLMWANVATRDNMATLAARGVVIFGPADGLQACGETGAGRLLEPEDLRDALIDLVEGSAEAPLFLADDSLSNDSLADDSAGVSDSENSNTLRGRSLVITAGPTHEAIDPVRFLGNRSSGRMGYAIAAAAAARGADVTLVSGPVSLETPLGVKRIDVVSAREMHRETLAAVTAAGSTESCDLFIAVAAVADYRVANEASQKIKKTGSNGESLSLELVRNPDILADVAALPSRPFCVGFAAETEAVEQNARGKLVRKALDMIAANHVAQASNAVFGSDSNALDVYWAADGHARIETAAKRDVAERLLDLIVERHAATITVDAMPAMTDDDTEDSSLAVVTSASAANDAESS